MAGLVWVAVAVSPWVVWALGWLVTEQSRDRTCARRAAQEAWQWLRARQREPLHESLREQQRGRRRVGAQSAGAGMNTGAGIRRAR